MSKSLLRAEAIEARRAIPRAQLARDSLLVEENLESLGEYRRSRTVATYVSKEDEVQTAGLIGRMLAEGRRVAVPLVDLPSGELIFFEIHALEDLSMGHFGILEPGRGAPPLPLADSRHSPQTNIALTRIAGWRSASSLPPGS